LLRLGGDSTFVQRWVGCSRSRADTNPETADGKEGGICRAHRRGRTGQSPSRLAVILVTLILPLQDCGRPLPHGSIPPSTCTFISLLRWGPTAHGHTVGMLSRSWSRDRGRCRSSSSWTCCPLSLHPLPRGPGLSREPAPPALGSGSDLGPCILCPGLRLLLPGPS